MPHTLPVSELQELAQTQYRRKDYKQALDMLNQAISSLSRPTISLLDNRAATYEKLEDLNSALKDARDTIKLAEADVTGYLRAGKLLQKMDKHSVALEIYKRGIRKKPAKVELLQKMHDKLNRSLSPPTATDPFSQLPIELVEYILAELSFKQTVYVARFKTASVTNDLRNCIRVSKQWRGLITGLPALWRNLDLTRAQKLVRSSFISACINRSRGHLESATVYRLAKPDEVLNALLRNCHHLHTLSVQHGMLLGKTFVEQVALATRLQYLELDDSTSIGMDSVSQILALCPTLKSLNCEAVTQGPWASPWRASFPNLQQLSLSAQQSCFGIDGVSVNPCYVWH